MKTTTHSAPAPAVDSPSRPINEKKNGASTALSVRRLNLMRFGYLVMGVGLAVTKWPLLINRSQPWPLYEGVTTYILIAMGLLALLGLRYPVKLLPILLLESAWKLIWLGAVAIPLWSTGDMDPATAKVADSVLWVVIVLAVIPWRYVVAQYVVRRGDPWRSDAVRLPGEGV